MKFRSIKRWNMSNELEGLLFFAQRMDELLWDFTLDTHKPMALNAPFLCIEAMSLLSDIESHLIEEANLTPVLEELIWSVQNDQISKNLLDLPIEHYVLTNADAKPSERKLRLSVLGKTLHPSRYLHRCFDTISEQVKSCSKIELDHSTRTMVTTLVNMGVSKQSLYKKSYDFFFSNDGEKIEKPEIIDDFLKIIYPFRHELYVYTITTDLITSVKDSLGGFSIKLLDEFPEDIIELAKENQLVKNEGESYVEIGPIEDFDVTSAQEEAVKKLDKLSDLFTLFHHKQKIDWRPTAIVKQCCLEKPVAITLTTGAMEKPYDLPQEKASKELNRLLRNFQLSGPSRERFNRVADLHGICVSTDVVENQLVTLWTALETLIPSHTGTSKISNVLESMIPFLMLAHVRRLVQRFNHDLIIWRKWSTKRILNSIPDIEGPSTIHRTLALLAVKENDPILKDLYGQLQDFQLLRFRAWQLSQILRTPEKTISVLETHEKKLRWQIRRIYRTRNLIVHSGKRTPYIHSLVGNGHDYLDQILFDVMRLSCGEYRVTTIEQAFELAKVHYKKFMNQLNAVQEFDTQNCAFLCKDYDTLTDYESEIWEKRSPRARTEQ